MGQPVAWFEIISPDAERAAALGGATLVPPTDLPGDFGKFAIFTDPDGNHVGLWA
jgi:hypothetical protein